MSVAFLRPRSEPVRNGKWPSRRGIVRPRVDNPRVPIVSAPAIAVSPESRPHRLTDDDGFRRSVSARADHFDRISTERRHLVVLSAADSSQSAVLDRLADNDRDGLLRLVAWQRN